MTKNIFILGALVVYAFGLTASAITKADFSGTWKLDAAKSTGLPPGMDQTMTVVQTGDAVKLETLVKGAPGGDQIVPDSYLLDGREHDFKPGNDPNAKGKRTAKMNGGGNGFEVTEKAEVETPDGERVTIEATRKWTLSADGKQLTIELKFKTPEGEKESKRVFVKQ